jgi:phosphatidylinositol glycan class K
MRFATVIKYIAASVCIASALAISVTTNQQDVEGFFKKSKSGHTNNWAVLVSNPAI